MPRNSLPNHHIALVGQFECDDAFTLARLALNTHVKEMGKPHTNFEPIQLKDHSGWHVRITLENSAGWLITYSGGTYV
jgi:hypothetical protein